MNKNLTSENLRKIPKIGDLLEEEKVLKLIEIYSINLVTIALKKKSEEMRKDILKGREVKEISSGLIIEMAEEYLKKISSSRIKKVINGTGIVIHTNLGRSILSEMALEELITSQKSYINLEYNIEDGTRGSRYDLVVDILKELTGCEDAIVVNNNASSVLLTIAALSKNKEAIISRGELVEIGGSFRVPEVIKLGDGILKEVGTTNRTHEKDYSEALGENTGIILKVHKSNYKIEGFTKEVEIEELISLSKSKKIPLYYDMGGASLVSLRSINSNIKEKTLSELINLGLPLISFSGDKIMGGPQCGIIIGKKKYIEKLKKHQLLRALRIDKLSLSALSGTLREYLNPKKAMLYNPTLRMLSTPVEVLEKRGEELLSEIAPLFPKGRVIIEKLETFAGGGSLPQVPFESIGVKIQLDEKDGSNFAKKLRKGDEAIIGRLNKGSFIIDVRTLLPGDIKAIKKKISGIAEVL